MIDYVAAAGHVVRRGLQEGDGNMVYKLPAWGWAVLLADLIVFLPILVFLGYTLNHVYPIFAIVEDPNPPAYEPVSLNEEPETGAGNTTAPAALLAASSKPITSSLRRTNRLVYSIGGWKSNFRGIGVALVLALATGLLAGAFAAIPFVGPFIGALLSSLALVQLSTAWIHIVISPPSELPFWRRLLPFKKVFEATCWPVLALWAAGSLARFVPLVLAKVLGMPMWRPEDGGEIPPEFRDSSVVWKSIVILIVALVITVFAVVPAHVILVRVQASLLDPQEDTVIPFDRSFEGTVEPAVVGGKGYVTMKNALKTFHRSSWIRLYVMYAKIFVVGLLLDLLMLAVLVPEMIVMVKKTTKD